MTAYVALVRGVNLLGASTLRMNDLRAIATELGLGSPRTLIASGNLLFTSPVEEEELRRRLEQRLQDHMGREVRVILRTAVEMEKIVSSNPFPELPGNLVQAFFLNESPPADLFATVRNQAEDERIAVGSREVFVAYGERGIGKSRLRISAAETGTARNMNTVAKLAKLSREMS